jgi:TRAP-type C4-dicarboxylate transport system permease small subunit
MAELPLPARRPADPLGRALDAVSRAFAYAGGLSLVGVTLMSLVSIAGRALFNAPLQGDYEIVQVGSALAVASFLPITQLRGGNVIVDFFTAGARPTLRATLDALGALLVALCAALIAWRMVLGAISLQQANDQTTILAFPTWIAVALMVPCFALLAVNGLYTASRHWVARAHDAPPSAPGRTAE